MRSFLAMTPWLPLIMLLLVRMGEQELLAQSTQGQIVGDISTALRQGHSAEALSLAQKALASHPRDCRLLSLQALAFSADHQQESALQSFQRALRGCPDYLPALEGASQIEVSRKSPAAIPLLQHVLAIEPGNLVAHGMLASTLQATGDCPGALPQFAASEPLFASNPGLQVGYAACLADGGDSAGALAQYRMVHAGHPSDANTLNIAALQWQTHQPAEVLETLDPLLQAGQVEPAFALASRAAEARGDTPRAVALLRTAILLAPDQIDNYIEFANLAFAHTSFQVGIDMLNAGIQRTPSSAPLYLARGVLEMQISRQKEALADFGEAHRLDPKLSLTDDALGIAQTQSHENGAALSGLRAQAQQHPDDALLQYLLAEQLAESAGATNEEAQAALVAAKRAAMLEPGYTPAHDLLAKLYLRAQQPKLALEQAKLALEQDPHDQEALYQQLMALRRTGNTAAAQALVVQLNDVRKQNAERQQSLDRYRLVEAPPQTIAGSPLMRPTRLFSLGFAALPLVLSGCHSQPKQPRIAVIEPTSGTEYWSQFEHHAKQRAARYGFQLSWSAPQSAADYEMQARLLNEAVQKHVDGIILAPSHQLVLAEGVRRANAEGIPVVIVTAPIAVQPSEYVTAIACSDEAMGFMAAQRFLSVAGDANILSIGASPTLQSAVQREESLRRALQRFSPKAHIAASRYSLSDWARARQVTLDALNADSSINAIFSSDEFSSHGVLSALRSVTRSRPLTVVTVQHDSEADAALRSGLLSESITCDSGTEAELAMDAMQSALHGKQVEKLTQTEVLSFTREGRTHMPVAEVTDAEP